MIFFLTSIKNIPDCSCCLCFIWAWKLRGWAGISKLFSTGRLIISVAVWIRTDQDFQDWKPNCFIWSFLFFWELCFWSNGWGSCCATNLRCCDVDYQVTRCDQLCRVWCLQQQTEPPCCCRCSVHVFVIPCQVFTCMHEA